MLHIFEDEDPCAFGNDEPIPILVPGARRLCRVVIVGGRQRFETAESTDGGGVDAAFCATSHHHVCLVCCNESERISDGMSPACASRCSSMLRSTQSMFDADPTSGHVDQHLGHEERREASQLSLVHQHTSLRHLGRAAHASTYGHAASIEIDLVSIPSRIRECFVRGSKGVSGERSLAARIVPLGVVECTVFNASRHASSHFRRQLLEACFLSREFFGTQLSYAAFATKDLLPYVRHADAQRRHQSKASHHHPPAHECRWIAKRTPNPLMDCFPTLLLCTCHRSHRHGLVHRSGRWSSDTAARIPMLRWRTAKRLGARMRWQEHV
mmetsp:Transcript_1883/g.11313  ORF Transcript_1883/g.11313 Transcript_1883/m.11313 type:complete len:326 (+) Transcript_1883:1160-2137(+)